MNNINIDNVPGALCIYKFKGGKLEPIVHNKAFFDIFGYSDENIKKVKERTEFLNVHPDDIEEFKKNVWFALNNLEEFHYSYRFYNEKKEEYLWHHMNGNIVDQGDEGKLCYVTYSDVSEERKTQKKYRLLIDTIPGGIALYEIAGDKVLTKFYSDGLCDLSGYSREERNILCKDDAMALTFEEDVPLLVEAIEKAIKDKSNINLNYRIKTKDGLNRYVNLRATYVRSHNGNPEFHAVFSDIDELKRLEKITKEQKLRYEVATKISGINVWEYDIQRDALTIISNSSRIKQNCYTIDDYVNNTVEHDYVRKDSLPTFYKLYQRLKNGEKEVIEDIWYKTTDKAGWWCERVYYSTIFDEYGKPIKAFGAGRDVTREKDAIEKFEEEFSYRTAIQGSSIGSLRINLTKNTIIDGSSDFSVIKELIEKGDVDYYFEKTAQYILGKEERKQFKKNYTRTGLISAFNGGEYLLTMEYTRTFGTEKIYWVKYTVYLMKNSDNNDIIALIVINDITDEKVMKMVMETVASTDYDFFVVVDGTTNTALDYNKEERGVIFQEGQPFEKRNEELIRQFVVAEDVERVIENCKIENIYKHIKNSKVYKFNYSMVDESGKLRRKQLQFTLISKIRKTFLMSRIDVDDIFVEQAQYQEKLKEALKNAQIAADAKTDFLSRMSHDIRTPLNAVIGLAGLGKESTSLEEMRNYHTQIEKSGEYLLAIVNDVLDMSKISSKTMVLKPTAVYLPEFIKDTVDIVKPTIIAKQINFKINQKGISSQYMRFDVTHVRQVVVNLLSNAIKFTQRGGNIELSLENVSRKENSVINRMTISDDGIGISEDFIDKLFLPFEQENESDDGLRNGTGLGLPIVKSIVEMMNGKIQVESEKGKGTAFIIEWEFQLAKAEDLVPKEISKSTPADSLKERNILLCEDHPLNTKIAVKLLENKGANVTVADNGLKGIEIFQKSEIGYFDAILMDIRMPIMGGLEATKQIRKLDRVDALKIPIIAMTANAFDDDVEKSLAAGMNAHLSKPIEPKKLYDTLLENMSCNFYKYGR